MAEKNKKTVDVVIPDIGTSADVDVIDILVHVGDEVTKEQSLVTLEGDKATMDIPSPMAGVVEKIVMKVGDKVSKGDLILLMNVVSEETSEKEPTKEETKAPIEEKKEPKEEPSDISSDGGVMAGPSVRRLARELGVNLEEVRGTGRKSRITTEDLVSFVKGQVQHPPGSVGKSTPIDFSQWGAIDVRPLNKIKRLTGLNVHRSWVSIPHVTQFDEADITSLEAFRKAEKPEGYKLTMLAFVCQVVVLALKRFPSFNASLDASGENLIYKSYFNIGIAVETPNGLVVPVIKHADALSVSEIAREMARISAKAREKGLSMEEMSGGCFTISSLGGIGGTAFTPIVNGPEVAILGLSRAAMKPQFLEGEFKPRLMLPLSLSYDHRVIDGAEAARFTRFVCDGLEEIRRILL